jgi:hypothetical protein
MVSHVLDRDGWCCRVVVVLLGLACHYVSKRKAKAMLRRCGLHCDVFNSWFIVRNANMAREAVTVIRNHSFHSPSLTLYRLDGPDVNSLLIGESDVVGQILGMLMGAGFADETSLPASSAVISQENRYWTAELRAEQRNFKIANGISRIAYLNRRPSDGSTAAFGFS